MNFEYCCGPIIFATGRGLCIAVQYSQNICYNCISTCHYDNFREGEACNHISATLYALVDITEKKVDGLNSATSAECKWVQPSKRKLSPKKAEDLSFNKYDFKKNKDFGHHKSAKKDTSRSGSKLLDIDKIQFAEKLRRCNPNAAFLQTIPIQEDMHSSSLPNLQNVPFQYRDSVKLDSHLCQEKFEEYFQQMSISENDVKTIQQLTKGQRKSKHWIEARIGRVTSSNFGQICKMRETTGSENVVKSIMNYNSFKSDATHWGNTHEAAARRMYLYRAKKHHPSLHVEECGLLTNPSYPYLGTSPDGLLHCPHCKESCGTLEIKCPYKYRTLSPSEAASQKDFFCELLDGKVTLKRNHNYYYQIQGQLAISGRKWCDFVVWTLIDHSVERIYYHDLFWNEVVIKLEKFYKYAVIPELFSSRVRRSKCLFNKD
ncbi:uncharacterized protein LOC130051168 [Ostrea edulis]|uniref:uncharacterized protein LOC130051168 n=1 Tax=Ostrea edulis TaxID=37623 RepID=UPI0024AFFD7C|nr:uncharacterized protein LOC130051168 [Ostrea edulis]